MTPPASEASLERLHRIPRTLLADLPTPLRPAPRLGSATGTSALYVKMDAETGFALGGNKVRKLEFELSQDRLAGITHLVTAGGPQSNHCRVTAAFAASRGLGCVLVVNGTESSTPTGNALLHRLFGARVVSVPDRQARLEGLVEAAGEIEATGGRALVVPIGASTPTGSLGYALAAVELVGQLDALKDDRTATRLFVSASSCGTLAGLLLGFALLGRDDVRVVAVSADAPGAEIRRVARRLFEGGAELLGASVSLPEFEVDDAQVGDGYGIPTAASMEAMERFGRLEGIVLDPTYTAKAAAGMLHALHGRAPRPGERVVFLHTGGAPGLFA